MSKENKSPGTDVFKKTISEKEPLLEKMSEEIDVFKEEMSLLEKELVEFSSKEKEIISKKEDLLRKKVVIEKDVEVLTGKEREIKEEEKSIEEREKQEEDPLKKKEIEKRRWEIEDQRREIEEKRWEQEQQLESVTKEIAVIEEDLKHREALNQESSKRKKEIEGLLENKEKNIHSLEQEITLLKEKKEEIIRKKESLKRAEEERSIEVQHSRIRVASLYEEALYDYNKGFFNSAREKFREILTIHGPYQKISFFKSYFAEKPIPQMAEEYLKKIRRKKSSVEKGRSQTIEEAKKKRKEVEEGIQETLSVRFSLIEKEKDLFSKIEVNDADLDKTKDEERIKKQEEEDLEEQLRHTESQDEREKMEKEIESKRKELEETEKHKQELENRSTDLKNDLVKIKDEFQGLEKERISLERQLGLLAVEIEERKEKTTSKTKKSPLDDDKSEKIKALYSEAFSDYKIKEFDSAEKKFKEVIRMHGPFKEIGWIKSFFMEKPIPQMAEEFLKKIEEERVEKIKKEMALEEEMAKKKAVIAEATSKKIETPLPETEIKRESFTIKEDRSKEESLAEQEVVVGEVHKEDLPVEDAHKEDSVPEKDSGEASVTEEVVSEEIEEDKEEAPNELYEEAEKNYNQGNLSTALEQFSSLVEDEDKEVALLSSEYVKKIKHKIKEQEDKKKKREKELEQKTREEQEKIIKSLYDEAISEYKNGEFESAEEKFKEVIDLYGKFEGSGFLSFLFKASSILQKSEEYLNSIKEERIKQQEEETRVVTEIREMAKRREIEEEADLGKETKELYDKAEMNYKQGKLDVALHQFVYLKNEDDFSAIADEYIKKIEERKVREEERKERREQEREERKRRREEMIRRRDEQEDDDLEEDEDDYEYKRRLVMENFKKDDEDDLLEEEEKKGEEKEEKKGSSIYEGIFRLKGYLQNLSIFSLIRQRLTVGVDVSDSSIEVIHLNKQRIILAYGRSIIKEGVIENGEILDPERLKKIIKETLKETKPMSLVVSSKSRMKGVVSLPESKIFVRQFSFDKEVSVVEKMKERMQETIPFALDDLYFDHHIIPSPESKKVSVICIAVEKVLVERYIELLRSIGIDPVAFDIESSSLGRALVDDVKRNEKGEVMERDKTEMIIDIGASKTVLSIFQNGALSFSVSVQLGGNYLTQRICDDLGCGFSEAEKRKTDTGVSGKLHPILSQELDKIIMEIKEADMYYEREFNKKIDKIILAGGSSLLPGIISYFEDALDREVVMGDPLKKVRGGRVLKGKESILFANVIGLALRGADKDPVRGSINLLPENIKAREFRLQQEERRPVIIIAATFAILGIIAIVVSVYLIYFH